MIMLRQMAILFIIMMIGLLANKIGILTKEVSKKISGLVVNVTNPCFIVSSVLNGTESINGSNLVTMAIIAVAMYACLMLLSIFVTSILCIPLTSRGTYKAMLVFGNIGFMGFPIVSGLYGNEALLYAAVFMLPYNVLIYSYGVRVIKSEQEDNDGFSLKNVINPGVIAAVVAIILYLTGLRMPYIVSEPIKMVSNITAPLSMMVIGASFASVKLKELFCDYKLIIFSVVKLMLIPIVGVVIVKLFVEDSCMQGIVLVMLGTPVGSMVPMLASEYGGDCELSSRGVAVSSILSIATLSILFIILGC